MAPRVDDETRIQILQSNLAKMTHLTDRGNEINSGQFFTDSVGFVAISSSLGEYDEFEKNKLLLKTNQSYSRVTDQHLLLDYAKTGGTPLPRTKRLNNETHLTASLDVSYNIESMAALHLRKAEKSV